MKILMIEDDKRTSTFVKKGLTSEGYTVDVSSDGEDGLFKALDSDYDTVILDVMLPSLDGISIAKKIRAKKKDTPIIMLTAKDAVEDRVEGLNSGADDYLTKPFSFAELLARIRSLSRRRAPKFSDSLKLQDLSLDPENHLIKRAGKEINLSATEFKLLKYMMENKGRVISRAMILENVWGYDFDPESNIVEVYMKYLRDKIEKGSKKPLIQTVHGVGYRLAE
jgi:DNA-binding response OmpR family regulator